MSLFDFFFHEEDSFFQLVLVNEPSGPHLACQVRFGTDASIALDDFNNAIAAKSKRIKTSVIDCL